MSDKELTNDEMGYIEHMKDHWVDNTLYVQHWCEFCAGTKQMTMYGIVTEDRYVGLVLYDYEDWLFNQRRSVLL